MIRNQQQQETLLSGISIPGLKKIFLLLLGLIPFVFNIHGDFLHDDLTEIAQNPNIQTLTPLSTPMWNAKNLPVRPIPYLSFAMNYSIHQEFTVGYHVVNLLIHFTSGVFIFLILNYLISRKELTGTFSNKHESLAWIIAIIWMVHPLQTMPVNYIYQRIELMWSCFFLMSIWGLILTSSNIQSTRNWGYYLCMTSCLLGMASKENMVIAPVFLLLFDWLIISRSWLGIRKKAWLYAGLFGSILLLALIVYGQKQAYGEKNSTTTPLEYLCTQSEVILHYFKLCFWPDPLIFDYDWKINFRGFKSYLIPFFIHLTMILFLLWGLLRKSIMSLPLLWFYMILAPSSSIMPVTMPAAEYRMYLPVLAVVSLFVLISLYLFQYLFKYYGSIIHRICMILVVAALSLTSLYRSCSYIHMEDLWIDNSNKRPENSMSYYQLGRMFLAKEKFKEAEEYCRKAAELRITDLNSWQNLGVAQLNQGKTEQAAESFRTAIKYIKPGNPVPYFNLALALAEKHPEEAIKNFYKVLEINPHELRAHFYLAKILGNSDDQKLVSQAMLHIGVVYQQLPNDNEVRQLYLIIRQILEEKQKTQIPIQPECEILYFGHTEKYVTNFAVVDFAERNSQRETRRENSLRENSLSRKLTERKLTERKTH